MKIYLVRVRERTEGGALYIERKPDATTNDDYIAISHVWGDPATITDTEIDGVGTVKLSPGKKDILAILRRPDICGESWFWMDLFCIDQRPIATISISEQLMAIPHIYKSSKIMKILIESPVCVDWHTTSLKVADNPETDREIFYEEELRHSRKCPNMLLLDPWFDRLWTRQEGLYARDIKMIPLNIVQCARLTTRRADGDKWVTEGAVRLKRALVHAFITDKLAYHGLPQSRANVILRLHFDLLYKHRVRMQEYSNIAGPHENYSPFGEVWRSGRQTAKPRDYVLAVFPDIVGYQVPPNPRDLTFKQLLVDAIQQFAALRQRLAFVSKVPLGMMVAPCSSDCAKPWIHESPMNTTEAYDSLYGLMLPHPVEDGKLCKVRVVVDPVTQDKMEPLNCHRDALADLVSLWESTADIIKHASFVALSGPCSGGSRLFQTKLDLFHRYLAHEFAKSAIAKFTENPDLRQHGIVNLENLKVPDHDFSLELRRFLVCLVCSTTMRTADAILEVADFRLVPSPYGKLIALVNRAFLRNDTESFMLVSTGHTKFHGLQVAVRAERSGFCHIVGKTMIPAVQDDTNQPSVDFNVLIADGYPGQIIYEGS
ncbi:hypothetical protein DFP73DRAFT_326341 [Morchella snyderi]|nr:hypothetical protein DFP73DRAFT_326341 [Morchella snyderi]